MRPHHESGSGADQRQHSEPQNADSGLPFLAQSDSSKWSISEANAANLLGITAANAGNLLSVVSNQIESLSARIDAGENALLESIVMQRRFLPRLPDQSDSRQPIVREPLSLDEAFARLERAAPLNWAAYRACLDGGTQSYAGLPAMSCSTERHPQARLFHAFLHPYLRGSVLDVGCGPQRVPSYMANFPQHQIFGIDPISKAEDHPFTFVSGVGEFIPFGDESFDVIVSGTSIDHYYLLDQGLREAARVLRSSGHFVAWITEFVGAPAYEPYSGPVAAYDSEHMYHIDRSWFLPLMQKTGFKPVEIMHFRLPFNYLFMSFEKDT